MDVRSVTGIVAISGKYPAVRSFSADPSNIIIGRIPLVAKEPIIGHNTSIYRTSNLTTFYIVKLCSQAAISLMMIILNTLMLNVIYILIPLESGIDGMGLSSVGSYRGLTSWSSCSTHPLSVKENSCRLWFAIV